LLADACLWICVRAGSNHYIVYENYQ
jgi:hypothetical protein